MGVGDGGWRVAGGGTTRSAADIYWQALMCAADADANLAEIGPHKMN